MALCILRFTERSLWTNKITVNVNSIILLTAAQDNACQNLCDLFSPRVRLLCWHAWDFHRQGLSLRLVCRTSTKLLCIILSAEQIYFINVCFLSIIIFFSSCYCVSNKKILLGTITVYYGICIIHTALQQK